MSDAFQVIGKNKNALFTLKIHRGDGMALLAMNWKGGTPPEDFVGFAIEYKEPGGARFFALKNRVNFPEPDGSVNPKKLSTRLSPIQKFRWHHVPRNAELSGDFVYRVTPVFMNGQGELSYGEFQEAAIELRRETYPGKLNVTFTRGFVSSQAFVDNYESAGPIKTLLPSKADLGLTFTPTHPKAKEALAWMGFEARSAILELLDQAIADEGAQVRVVAYDLSEREFVERLEQLGGRLKIIIDNSAEHKKAHSGESQGAKRLARTAGKTNVRRQHMGGLQHNKTIVVDGPQVKAVVCGSTNYSWRGFYVQSNNALVIRGEKAVAAFNVAFEAYWDNKNSASVFGESPAAMLNTIDLDGIDVQVGFAPFAARNSLLKKIADDIRTAESSVFYSLAFLAQTPGVIMDALEEVTNDPDIFVYGIADKEVGGIEIRTPDGNVAPVSASALSKNVPQPFKAEPTGGGGTRMHHKCLIVDFNTDNARVYLGSYNFSVAADEKNGENLVLIHDRRIATSYAIEALRIFDHYHFRVTQQKAKKARKALVLQTPPKNSDEEPWWAEDYNDPRKVRDRELFA